MTAPLRGLSAILAAALLLLAGLCGAAQADPFGIIQFHSYKPEYRPVVVFPRRPRTAASTSAPTPPRSAPPRSGSRTCCWKKCTGATSWRHDACIQVLSPEIGVEACRYRLDADNRACLRACRTRGGPMVNLAF